MTKWQPIETAPKDGTELLLLTPSGYAIGEWQDYEPDQPDQPGHDAGWYALGPNTDSVCWGRTRAAGFAGSDSWIYEATNQPTHWMPLPEPPEDSQ